MARNPTSKKNIKSRDMLIGTPIKPTRYKEFKQTEDSLKPAEDLRLSEYVAAVRREVEAVALIAAPEDKSVPHFHVSEVELELVCAVSEVSDDGLRVTVDQAKLKDTPDGMLQRVKLKLTDPVVIQIQADAKDRI